MLNNLLEYYKTKNNGVAAKKALICEEMLDKPKFINDLIPITEGLQIQNIHELLHYYIINRVFKTKNHEEIIKHLTTPNPYRDIGEELSYRRIKRQKTKWFCDKDFW